MNGTVKEWLDKAEGDFHTALREMKAIESPNFDAVCFHAQQCAEKALKALLLHRGISFPRTHAIEVLLDLLKAQGTSAPQGVDDAFELSEYAVQTRYPGEWEPVTKEEARRAIEQAGLVLAWVEAQLEQ